MALDISVIVPTYNRADLIPATLDSILAQTFRPAEIIVVDDGSTDATEAVVRQYEGRVRYLRIKNAGECGARNAGVSISSSRWLAFCDSDDLWQPDKLSRQLELFQQAPDVEYGFTNFQTVIGNDWSQSTKFDTLPPEYWALPRQLFGPDSFVVEESLFARLVTRQPIFPSTLMMTRNFFERVGRWDEPLGRTPSVDLEFHLRCVSAGKTAVISAPMVGIRKHGGNFSANPLKTTIGEIAVLKHVLAKNPEAASYASLIHEQIAIRAVRAAEGAFAAGDFEQTRRFLTAVPPHHRSWKLEAKKVIAHCPGLLSRLAHRAATGRPRRHRQQAISANLVG